MKASGMTFGDTKSDYFTFFAPNKNYEVTKFQRPYAWGSYQVQGMINDLEYLWKRREEGTEVSWANILIQQQPSSKNPNTVTYDIGDGQQRIITVNLALLAIWRRGQELLEYDTESDSSFLDILIPTPSSSSYHGTLATLVENVPGSNSRYTVSPRVKFQLSKVQTAFEQFFKYSNVDSTFKDELKRVLKAVAELDSGKNYGSRKTASAARGLKLERSPLASEELLFANFNLFYQYYVNSDFKLADLAKLADIICTRFCLTVHEYEPYENMQRAFSNMNSYGVSLTQSELVKSELYGIVRKKNLVLSDQIAMHWTENYETQCWKKPRKTKNRNPQTYSPETALDYCLRQALMSRTQFGVIQSQRLKDSWAEYIEVQEDMEFLWSSIKEDIKVYETAVTSEKSYVPGTADWAMNYCYQIIGNSGEIAQIISVIMKLRRTITDDTQFCESMRLLSKFFLYIAACYPVNLNNTFDFLTREPSVLRKDSFTLDEFKHFLENLNAKSAQWGTADKLEQVLNARSFEPKMNALVSEMFIFVNNEQKRQANDTSSLSNSSMALMAKSREHILPQKPKNSIMTPEEKNAYDHLVGLLGNTIVITTEDNRTASNKNVEDKIGYYNQASNNAAWGIWIREFLDDYQNAEGIWGKEQIQERTARLSKQLSTYLVSDNPNVLNLDSKFRVLLETYGQGAMFYAFKDNDEIVEFTIADTGELETIDMSGNKYFIFRVAELTDYLGKDYLVSKNRNYKNLLHVKNDDGSVTSLSQK